MNSRSLIVFIVAICIMTVTAIVIKNRLQQGGEQGVKVLVAANDIPVGAFIHADKDVTWALWPQGNISASFITTDAHKIEEFNASVARRPITAGEPITATSLVKASDGGFMSAVLTAGKRAVSIAVNPTSGNAGFVFPGDKVDLLLTHKIPVKDGGSDVLASETFIQDVRVLAIDQMLDNPDNKAVVAKTITLEVSPKQAEMINVAQSLGAISVSLRSLSGTVYTSVTPAGKVALKPMEPAPQAPDYSTDNDVSKLMNNNKNPVRSKVSVYHGSTSEQIDFHQGAK